MLRNAVLKLFYLLQEKTPLICHSIDLHALRSGYHFTSNKIQEQKSWAFQTPNMSCFIKLHSVEFGYEYVNVSQLTNIWISTNETIH